MKNLLIGIFNFLINLYSIFYLGIFITDYSFIFDKGFSNISGLTVLFLFLLLVRYFLDKQTFRNLFIFVLIRKISFLNDKTLLCIAFLSIFSILTGIGIARHLSLSSNAWDMGIFDQAFWNTLHGDTFFSSIRGMNLLGDHFEPILFLMLPFYAIWPHAFTLIIIQAFFLAGAVFPLYLIARNRLKSRFLVFVFIISFALSKGLRGIGLSDFHPESFMVFFSLLAFYFLIKKKNVLFFVMILLLLACKETAVLVVIGLGIYVFISLKRRGLGLSLVVIGISAWIIETKTIIPFFSPTKTFFYFRKMPFGFSYGENIWFVLRYPFKFLRFIFMPEKIEYFLKLVAPLGFLSLFAPGHYILIALPLLIIFLASENFKGYYLLSSHYVSHVLPFIYISAIYGVNNLLNFLDKKYKFNHLLFKKAQLTAGCYIMVMSLLFYTKSDISKFYKFINGAKENRASEKLSYLSLVPQDASVMANFNLVPHLSHRKYVYDFYLTDPFVFKVDYIILDLDALDYLNEPSRQRIPEFLEELPRKGYEEIFSNADNSFLIFHHPHKDKTRLEKLPRN